MASRTSQRRQQLDRAGIAEHLGTSIASVNRWHLNRATSGFPEKASTDSDGRDWWWRDDIDTFHTAHLAARAAQFTRINRHGGPDDLLNGPQAAKILGYKDHRSLPVYLMEHPDQIDELPSGLKRRYWHRHTLWAWADARALRHSTGRPIGTGTGPHQDHPYASDPRLPAAIDLIAEAHAAGRSITGLGAKLARRLDISERTGQRLIAAAQDHDDERSIQGRDRPERGTPPGPQRPGSPGQPKQYGRFGPSTMTA
jgi:hypothetical protein